VLARAPLQAQRRAGNAGGNAEMRQHILRACVSRKPRPPLNIWFQDRDASNFMVGIGALVPLKVSAQAAKFILRSSNGIAEYQSRAFQVVHYRQRTTRHGPDA
jgi:hypothetical protein